MKQKTFDITLKLTQAMLDLGVPVVLRLDFEGSPGTMVMGMQLPEGVMAKPETVPPPEPQNQASSEPEAPAAAPAEDPVEAAFARSADAKKMQASRMNATRRVKIEVTEEEQAAMRPPTDDELYGDPDREELAQIEAREQMAREEAEAEARVLRGEGIPDDTDEVEGFEPDPNAYDAPDGSDEDEMEGAGEETGEDEEGPEEEAPPPAPAPAPKPAAGGIQRRGRPSLAQIKEQEEAKKPRPAPKAPDKPTAAHTSPAKPAAQPAAKPAAKPAAPAPKTEVRRAPTPGMKNVTEDKAVARIAEIAVVPFDMKQRRVRNDVYEFLDTLAPGWETLDKNITVFEVFTDWVIEQKIPAYASLEALSKHDLHAKLKEAMKTRLVPQLKTPKQGK